MKQKTLETINKNCDKISTFGFYALSYFLPITTALTEWSFAFVFLPFVYKRTAHFIDSVKKSSSRNIKEISRLFIFSYKPAASCLNKPIGLYVLIIFISILLSEYRLLGLKNFVFDLLQCVYFYFIFIEVMVNRKRLKIFLGILLVSFSLITINGLFQGITGSGFIHRNLLHDQRVASSFKHANDFGSYLVMLLPIVLSLTWFFKRMRANGRRTGPLGKEGKKSFLLKIFWWLMVLLFILGAGNLGFTFSRGAWTGFIVSLLFLGLIRKRKILHILLVIVVFLGVFYPKIVAVRQVSFVSDQTAQENRLSAEDYGFSFSRLRESLMTFGGMGRKTYWSQAVNVIKHHPLIGSGLSTYSMAGEKYNTTWQGYYAHNCYLQMAAEIGIFGLFAFFWIVGKAFVFTLRNLKGMKGDFSYLLVSGILTGVFGFLIHGFFDTNFYSVQLITLFWVCLGWLIAVQMLYFQDDPAEIL